MSFSTRTSRFAALFSASALVLALAACDGDDTTDQDTDDASESSDDADSTGISDDPETALKDAVAAMADWDGVALELSVQADDAARASILENDPQDEELFDVLMNSSVSMVATGDETQGAVQLAVNVDGTDVFEMYVGADGDTLGDFALRVDLPAISELADDPSMTAELDAMIGQAAMFGLEDAAEALANGDWISISGLEEMATMMDDLPGMEEDPEVDEEQAEAAVQALAARTERFVDEDVTVAHVGSDDAGERLQIIAPGPALEAYLGDVVDILASNDLVDGFGAQDLQSELEGLDADDVTLDVWISGGEISQFALDVTELDEEAEVDGEFLLIVGLSDHGGSLSAPSAAATVDVMSLFGQFMGGMGDLGLDDLGGEFDDDLSEEGSDLDSEELSDADIDMMLGFMDCISEEDLEGFQFFMPEVAEAAEQRVADGTLELC